MQKKKRAGLKFQQLFSCLGKKFTSLSCRAPVSTEVNFFVKSLLTSLTQKWLRLSIDHFRSRVPDPNKKRFRRRRSFCSIPRITPRARKVLRQLRNQNVALKIENFLWVEKKRAPSLSATFWAESEIWKAETFLGMRTSPAIQLKCH